MMQHQHRAPLGLSNTLVPIFMAQSRMAWMISNRFRGFPFGREGISKYFKELLDFLYEVKDLNDGLNEIQRISLISFRKGRMP